MNTNLLILAFIIIFMLHNLEEIITVERWMKRTYPRVRNRIPLFAQKEIEKFQDITAAQFAVVVFVLSIPCSALILVAAVTEHYFLFLGINLIFALNIFTHPLQSLFLRCYTPGVWTSILLVIPYNIWFFYHFAKAGMLTMNNIAASFVVAVLFIPVFLLSHKIGEKWS